jgi:hypothetical protein
MVSPGFWALRPGAQDLAFRLFSVAEGQPIPALPTFLARELYNSSISHFTVAWRIGQLVKAGVIDWFDLEAERFLFFPGTPVPEGAQLVRLRGFKN